ncbi:isocitrate lyase/PEP mutase family protein [Leptospira sarikeiensis]|uniref:Isocitrate lyase/phosphoenolpyruvate mutase family protein n=1 Tax=Leptospira sarikeiensis TaxID=2484943 RepID=A0A4R9K513_9LEPT|nr:isocitrate lyase/phosphoenolpyruvate mutase family protein [Leptospira sarikeiensis]TGL60573.1 isocitrate lyase/phosphoenolpyruvate mutase family protein [Leptospira sarikeiensis]
MKSVQLKYAEIFQKLHTHDIFVMPNAWDAGSARMLVGSGFSAIGTTSAGIAFAAGLPDHQILDRDSMLGYVKKIVDSVDVPVSADLEAGYGIQPEEVAETIKLAIGIGVVGCNIEDLSGDPIAPLLDHELAAERIRAAKQTSEKEELSFTLTARTDAFLTNHPNALEEAIRRCNLYHSAGADCLFIPGVNDPQTIGTLVRSINGPLNVVMGLGKNDLTVSELRSLGVRRISIGGSLARACFYLIQQAALEIKTEGSFTYSNRQYGHKDLCDFFQKFETRMGSE